MKISVLITALALGLALNINTHAADVTPAEARAIAKDAYVFCFPLNYYYRTIYSQIVDQNNKKSLGGFGKWRHDSLATPAEQGNDDAEQRHAL